MRRFPPERIVCLTEETTETLYLLGQGDRIVGTVTYFRDANDEAIIKAIFNGTREPATGWVSPVVDGYKADVCGEFCKYDPDEAIGLDGALLAAVGLSLLAGWLLRFL